MNTLLGWSSIESHSRYHLHRHLLVCSSTSVGYRVLVSSGKVAGGSDRFFWWSGGTTTMSTTSFFLYLQFWTLNRIFLVRGGLSTGGYLRGWSTTRWDVRQLSVALPDDMDRLQGSGVRSSVQHHGRGAGGVRTGDRRHPSTRSSPNDLALAWASKLTCFLFEWSKLTWFQSKRSKLTWFSVGLGIDLVFVRVVEIDLSFVYCPKMTWFYCGHRNWIDFCVRGRNWLGFRVWSEMICFEYGDWLGFCMGVKNNGVWIEIGLIFVSGHRNWLDFSVEVETNLVFAWVIAIVFVLGWGLKLTWCWCEGSKLT